MTSLAGIPARPRSGRALHGGAAAPEQAAASALYRPDMSIIPTFYTGTHRPGWLWDGTINFPLMVSDRQLRRHVNCHAATVPGWCLDSGGFSELQMNGGWTVSGREYIARVARYDREVGRLEWAAPRDLMCEPFVRHGGTLGRMRFAGTGLTEERHQRLTVQNYVEDTALWPEYSDEQCPLVPVVQGWLRPDSYERCYGYYQEAGVDLSSCFLVGIGSVCRQQSAAAIRDITRAVGQWPVVTHWFGVKLAGARLAGIALDTVPCPVRETAGGGGGRVTLNVQVGPLSMDSLAWSDDERWKGPHKGRRPACTHRAVTCSGCRVAAGEYRDKVNAALREVFRARPPAGRAAGPAAA